MNAPWNPARAGTRDPFLAFVCDENSAETLRAAANEQGWPPEKITRGGLRNAIQTLSVSASPTILFVDLTESSDPLNDINALAEVCEPGTIVLACGQVNDVRLYRELMASGIHDYLLKPLNPDALRDAFAHAYATIAAPKVTDAASGHAHCAVAVVGTRGGVGASTMATSIAWLISDRDSRSTALLDLDVHFGTGALSLDLEPGRGLTDAIENPGRIDGLFIERAMVRASDKLAVLSAEAPIHSPVMTDGDVFQRLQEELRGAFECTVIDMPRSMLVQFPQLLADVNAAVLVTEFTLAAARDAIRILAWFRTNAPQTQVLVVANRVQGTVAEIARKDFETSIERKVDYVVPYDLKLCTQAAKLGKPMADAGKGSKTVAPIGEVVRHILTIGDAAGDDAGPRKKGKSASLLEKLAIKLPMKVRKKQP